MSFGLPFSATLVVISQVQTQQDSRWVKACQRNVSNAGFAVGLKQNEAAKMADVVTDAWYQISSD